ncbi:MAG: hypothetical protein QW275_03795, partial [Candidatus Anstonellaceae archaeon]
GWIERQTSIPKGNKCSIRFPLRVHPLRKSEGARRRGTSVPYASPCVAKLRFASHTTALGSCLRGHPLRKSEGARRRGKK